MINIINKTQLGRYDGRDTDSDEAANLHLTVISKQIETKKYQVARGKGKKGIINY